MCLQFWFVIFWPKDFGAKAAHKMLVKLTPGRPEKNCVIWSPCLLLIKFTLFMDQQYETWAEFSSIEMIMYKAYIFNV